MPFLGGEIPYSVEDCFAYPYAAGVAGTGVDLVGIFKVDAKSAVQTAEHRGDNKVLATSATYSKVDLTIALHQFHFASVAAVAGGTVTASGTTPNQVNKLRRMTTDTVADFKLEVQTHSKDAAGGAFRVTYPRCQWQGGPDYNFDDNAFPEITTTASAIGDAGSVMFDFEQYETYTALT